MENYFLNQTEIYEELKKFLTNFKKDGADRKTMDYCKRKLQMLETYWSDYSDNHIKMCELAEFDHVYFKKSCNESAEELYLTIKSLIEDTMQKLTLSLKPLPIHKRQRSASPRNGNEVEPGTSTPIPPSNQPPAEPGTAASIPVGVPQQHTNSSSSSGATKMNEMLKKQNINFRAFMRTVNNIDIDQMQDKWELEDALKNLQTRWTVIDNFHWEIEGEKTEENLWYQSEFTKHEKLFNDLKKRINIKMWSTTHRMKSTPEVSLPVFGGSYLHWTSFKDLFTETIHKNPSLSKAQKMQFLKGNVTGEAERLIQHLLISSDNYDVCWEILNHRFNNKKLIFASHINTLFGLPNMQHQSLNLIKKLHDVTKETLHAVTNLGVDITTWDPLLVHLLAQKLDGESFAEYMESVKNPRELPVLQEFLEFLESKFTILEASRRKQEPANQKPSTQPQPQKHEQSN